MVILPNSSLYDVKIYLQNMSQAMRLHNQLQAAVYTVVQLCTIGALCKCWPLSVKWCVVYTSL